MRFKSSRILDCLDTITESIDRIDAYREWMRMASASEEEMAAAAAERCLDRPCEAVHRLTRGEVDLEAMAPEIAWADVRGFGNRLRHEYDRLDSDTLDRVLAQLPQLHKAAVQLKTRFDPDQSNLRPMA